MENSWKNRKKSRKIHERIMKKSEKIRENPGYITEKS